MAVYGPAEVTNTTPTSGMWGIVARIVGTSGTPVAPSASVAVASSKVFKASPGTLGSLNVVSGAIAGYVMLFDATSAPVDGAVTPARCWPLAAYTGLELNFSPPLNLVVGVTVVFSSTGPYTKTASATAFIAGEVV